MTETQPQPAPQPAPRRRRGRYAKSAERQRVIVAAAMRVFASRGYRATSLREVAAAAGISLSTLVHHFPTKEELLLATLRGRDEAGTDVGAGKRAEADAGIPGSAEADASTLERAEADASTPQSAEADAGTLERAEADAGRFLELVLEQARGNESVRGLIELYTVVCAEATTEGHPGADYFRGRFARLRAGYAAHFTALAACGRLRPGVDPRRAATSLVALWDGLQLQWLLEPEEVDVAQHLSDFLRLVTGEPA